MQVKFKKLHPEATIPTAGSSHAAGLDLKAVTKQKVYHKTYGFLEYLEYDTKLAVEIPEGYVGLIYPRSSISKYNLTLANCVGVIDADYRGSITFRFRLVGAGYGEYDIGDRIGQLIIMPYPKIEPIEAIHLSETERGDGGYGSTGN